MTAHDFYQQGKLDQAIAAALGDVKQNPTEVGKRGFLAELLCFAGDFERAVRQLDAIGDQGPDIAMDVSLFRLLIQAEQARQQFFVQGRMPEFLNQEITPILRLHLEAAVHAREGMQAEAANLLAQAAEQRPKAAGVHGGKPFDDLCDLDDLTSSFFEILTARGEYFWIPFDRVESIEFLPYTRPRDLLWRCAHLQVHGESEADVFVPVLYPGSAADPNDAIKLGRATEWTGEAGTPIRGRGQRIYLIGEEDHPILELTELTFGTP